MSSDGTQRTIRSDEFSDIHDYYALCAVGHINPDIARKRKADGGFPHPQSLVKTEKPLDKILETGNDLYRDFMDFYKWSQTGATILSSIHELQYTIEMWELYKKAKQMGMLPSIEPDRSGIRIKK